MAATTSVDRLVTEGRHQSVPSDVLRTIFFPFYAESCLPLLRASFLRSGLEDPWLSGPGFPLMIMLGVRFGH